jgi:epsilon-lactone hydrolase
LIEARPASRVLLIDFVALTSLLREQDRPSTLPIIGNGPPGTFVLFPNGLKVSLPTDQIVFADDTGGHAPLPGSQPHDAARSALGGQNLAGSATAYRHLVGHIAARAGTRAFVPDYRLAPEHPFPAAVDDVLATYHGMDESGIRRIAVTGDSAGGNLALVLASRVAKAVPARVILV